MLGKINGCYQPKRKYANGYYNLKESQKERSWLVRQDREVNLTGNHKAISKSKRQILQPYIRNCMSMEFVSRQRLKK